MIGVAKPLGGVQQPFEKLFALEKRRFAKVVPIAIEQIENVVNDRGLSDYVLAGSAHVHAFLQALEVAVASGIKRDDFSIENRVARSDRLRKRGQLGITFGDVQVVSRAQH